MRRAVCSLGLAFLLALLPVPARGTEGPRLWITDAHGNTAAPLFADTLVVPGQQLTETLLIHHTDAADAPLELRLNPLTAPNALESDLHLTVSTPAGSTSEPLSGLLREDRPLGLGTLPSEGSTPVEFTVELPETSGNRTKKLVTAFRPVVTAYAPDLPGLPDHPTAENPADAAPTGGSTAGNDPSGATVPPVAADDAPPPVPPGPGTLPHTGTNLLWLLALIVICGALGGWLLFRARRGAPTPGATQGPPENVSRP